MGHIRAHYPAVHAGAPVTSLHGVFFACVEHKCSCNPPLSVALFRAIQSVRNVHRFNVYIMAGCSHLHLSTAGKHAIRGSYSMTIGRPLADSPILPYCMLRRMSLMLTQIGRCSDRQTNCTCGRPRRCKSGFAEMQYGRCEHAVQCFCLG
jgi:hypothetical protein